MGPRRDTAHRATHAAPGRAREAAVGGGHGGGDSWDRHGSRLARKPKRTHFLWRHRELLFRQLEQHSLCFFAARYFLSKSIVRSDEALSVHRVCACSALATEWQHRETRREVVRPDVCCIELAPDQHAEKIVGEASACEHRSRRFIKQQSIAFVFVSHPHRCTALSLRHRLFSLRITHRYLRASASAGAFRVSPARSSLSRSLDDPLRSRRVPALRVDRGE